MSTIHNIAVLGAGTMGHGIAQVCAAAGYRVALHDPNGAQLASGIARVQSNLARGVERGKLTDEARATAESHLRAEPRFADAVASADLVIEAAPESMELKRSIFEALDTTSQESAILATNTSSLSVTEIAAATGRADRVIGLHFFNPVHIMRLLEIVRGSSTSDDVIEDALAFADRIDKDPIVVTDTPGFASSRLGVVLGLEAMRMLEQGVASAQDIDRAMELGYRHPMGPLRLTDLVGLDVRLGIAEYLHRTLGGEQYRPPDILREMVDEGRLGKKAGRGFYDWSDA